MNEVARCSTRINQSSPTSKAIKTAQGEQVCVTARTPAGSNNGLQRLNPRYWCRVTVFDLCAIVPGRNLPARLSMAYVDSGAEKRSPLQSKWSVPWPDDVNPPWVDNRTSRKPYKLERILMLSQQEMEDFMAVEAALDERDELAARRRNASDAAGNSIDPSDDLPKTSDPA